MHKIILRVVVIFLLDLSYFYKFSSQQALKAIK